MPAKANGSRRRASGSTKTINSPLTARAASAGTLRGLSNVANPASVTTSRAKPQPSSPRSSRRVAGPGTPALNLAHPQPDAHTGAAPDEDSHLVMRSMVADGTRTPPWARAPSPGRQLPTAPGRDGSANGA